MTSMRVPRVKISVRGTLYLVALIAAYLAGAVPRRSEFLRTLDHMNWARQEVDLEVRQREFELAIQMTVTGVGDLDRIEKLLDRLDAYDARISGSRASDVEP